MKIYIIFVCLGLTLSQLLFIPSWETTQAVSMMLSYGLAMLFALIYFVKVCREKGATNKGMKIGIAILGMGALPFLLIFSIVTMGQGLFGAELKKEATAGKFYVFQKSCFPPDSNCECSDYHSLIYRKYRYLPLMQLHGKVDFYASTVTPLGEGVQVDAANICPRDLGKRVILP